MRWIINLLDFRLWNGAGQGGGGQGGGGQGGGGAGQGAGGAGAAGGPDQGGGGEGGYGSQRSGRGGPPNWSLGMFGRPAPAPAPAEPTTPPREPGPTTERHYARHLEDVRQRNRGAATMPAYAQDYELPDTAFGSRIY